jgi:hypothetical protein
LLLAVFRKRALSTMGALGTSIERRMLWLDRSAIPVDPWTQARLNFGEDDHDDVESADDRHGLFAPTGLGEDVERSWLKRLAHVATVAAEHESKVTRLVRLLSRTSEPVIVFTEFRHSLSIVRKRLGLARSVVVLHGGMSASERTAALEEFQDGRASVLLATDVAGQGLNLQTRCRWVISLELPWNPARLEQRIGRVDRIGQRKAVHFTLLIARDETEDGLISHLARRVLSARRPFGDAALIDIPASEDDIRKAVIDRTPLPAEAQASQPIGVCGDLRRAARIIAIGLEQRRALRARWRGPETNGRPILARMRRPLALGEPELTGQLLIFSVPFLDRGGAIVERHLVAIRVSIPELRSGGSLPAEWIRHASTLAVRCLERRLARARRIHLDRLEKAVARERAVVRTLRKEAGAGMGQPGLFDKRELRALDAAQTTIADIDRDLDARVHRAQLSAQIDQGRPTLEIIFV